MYFPEFYLADMTLHIPLIFILSAFCMVFSMKNKWHWFLLVPLVLCLWGLRSLYATPLQYSFQRNVYIQYIILTIVFVVMLVSVLLSNDPTETYQVVLCGIAMVLMALVAFVIIFFVSSIKNIYTQITGVVFVCCLFIVSLLFLSIDNPTFRKNMYITSISLSLFFMVYYIGSLNVKIGGHSKKQIQSQPQSQFGFVIRQFNSVKKTI